MHEFLLDIKRWQTSSAFQKPLSKIKNNEASCITLCEQTQGDEASKCIQNCKSTRIEIERHMYKK